jgi:hypothetical protein
MHFARMLLAETWLWFLKSSYAVYKHKKGKRNKDNFLSLQAHIQKRNKISFILYAFLFKKQFHMKFVF